MSTSPKTRSFDAVLVANRGEIAVRVLRTAKRLGYRTIAVYSDVDRAARHVKDAVRAVALVGNTPKETYLDIDKIVKAAAAHGAVAIHPGYGFLSENAALARAVVAAGLVFVGPAASSIDAMGDKSKAKARMIEAGVPCVPGYHGSDQSESKMVAESARIGFPIMVKAAAGGGGRGMRLVHSAADLPNALQTARSESENAFGNGELLLERAVVGARHVEIQVFGDTHGNVVHFGERDCSIQRRNQKVVEESPSPAVDEPLRRAMGDAAVKAARAVDYVGAGTIEFLLAPDGAFYFLEMNTRLQVEHPVTELVYDVDLVEWQLRVAAGEALPWTQEEILARRKGHAIEVRLCAENADYIPETGTVFRYREPSGDGIRVDTFLESGTVISPYYDSMLGKIIAHGDDRESARRRLATALAGTTVLGVTTNRDFLRAIVGTERFASGQFSTSFLTDEPRASLRPDPAFDLRHIALASLTLWLADAAELQAARGYSAELSGWASAVLAATPLTIESGALYRVRVQRDPRLISRFTVHVIAGQQTASFDFDAALDSGDGETVRYVESGGEHVLRFVRDGERLWLDAEQRISAFRDRTHAPVRKEEVEDGILRAHGAGKILRVNVAAGDTVERGQTLVVIESMKLEFELKASRSGVVGNLNVAVGDQVIGNRILLDIQLPAGAPAVAAAPQS